MLPAFSVCSFLCSKPHGSYPTAMQSKIRGVVGILGFGVDGQGVAEWLVAQDAVDRILVFDDKVSNAEVQKFRKAEIGSTLEGIDLLFRSPGFPLIHPLIADAKKREILITSSTREVLKNFSGNTVGITGSNGKTTCTALIQEFLKGEYGEERVERGGNDGVPRLDLIEQKKEDCFLVLELSSFQLIDSEYSPNVAVVLNVTPNHLDWHRDMGEYAEAKRQIVAHPPSPRSAGLRRGKSERQIAVLNQNDPIVKKFAEGIKSDVHWFTDDVPFDQIRVKSHPDTIRAAITAARALKVSESTILKVLQEFKGVPHRIEFVRELDGIKYYNDSSCTTPESAIVACEAFEKGSLTILLGGRDKKMDFSNLYEVIKERDVAVVPYGEMAATFQKNIPTSYHLQTTTSFEEAIQAARSTGRPNIVLSPSCTSFDMFKNAKERGKKFGEIVQSF